jgi:penicillin-binding protein 1A
LKLNQNFSDRRRATKDERAKQRALYLSTLPKNRWKRLAYRMHPQRLAAYWFSREGAIMALKITGIGIIVCFFLVIGVFAYFRKDLPKITGVAGSNLGGSISYYDRTGKILLFQDYDAIKRIPVAGNEISPYMKNATVAIEDKDFYKHGAFDLRGIMRAGINDVLGHGPIQGGSTITQQLVKLNEQWTSNRTITRKVKELILAVELEREYSKADILTGYLNTAPYGGIENGVEAAAQDYFHTSAKKLTLAQASFLAAIPQSPSYYSPYSSSKWNKSVTGTDGFGEQAVLNRQRYILDQMVQQGYINADQAAAAKKVDVLAMIHPLSSKYNGIKAPYFVLAAKHQLEQQYGEQTVQRGGWKVITTMDDKLQNLANKLVQENRSNVEQYGGDEEAMAAEDVKTGQMVALVGGVDFGDPDHGQINYAQINISPGSSFKPYDYSTFIENHTNVGAGSVLYDKQQPLPGWPCTNKVQPKYGGNCLWDYDFHYPGAVSIRYGLAGSRNVPAVKAMLTALPNDTSQDRTASINKVIKTADAMMVNEDGYRCFKSGVNVESATKADQKQCYGSSAIGDGAYLHLDNHVNGLSTLARLGKAIPQTYIMKISDASNHTIYKWTQPKAKQVIKPDTAFILNSMLSDPRASYLSYFRKFQNWNGWKIAVKTGTTNDNFDGLMTSWTTKYAVASWVGYHTRNKSMTAGHMEAMTEPLTRDWMQGALGNSKPVNWQKPSDVKTLPAYVQRTHVGDGSIEPGPSTDYYPSWYSGNASKSSAQTIDKVSQRLATSCTPPLARQTVGGANANIFNVDEFAGGGGSSTSTQYQGSDNVHNCGDSTPAVVITVPTKCDDQDCPITVSVTAGTHPLSSSQFPSALTVQVDGKTVGKFSPTGNNTYTINYKATKTGTATVKATITDSVLYQGSDSKTLTETVPPKVTSPGTGTGGNPGGGPGNGGGQNP